MYLFFVGDYFLCALDSSGESQAPEGKGGSSGWPGGLERRGGLGQHPRPRAFSQSAVHTLEQRERERDLERVRRLLIRTSETANTLGGSERAKATRSAAPAWLVCMSCEFRLTT